MTESGFKLPTLLATSVVRGAEQDESHGGVFQIDFAGEEVRRVVDWHRADVDFSGHGGGRGLRGIAFFAGEIYIASSDQLLVFDQAFRIRRSFRSSYLKHCHEIHQLNNHLYLTSTGHDSILAFDLEKQSFFWALHLALGEDGPVGTAYDPQGINGPGGANGPPAQNLLHLNNVYANSRGLFVSGLHTSGMYHVGNGNVVSAVAEMPEGIHNARPFRDGVLFNDTASNRVCYVGRDGTKQIMRVPVYDPEELTGADSGDDQLARQGFGRGLCVLNERLIAAGSSPSTVTIWDVDSGRKVSQVNFSMDIRNAIHGLEVWPY